MTLNYRLVNTAGGWMGLVWSQRGLRRVYLPERAAARLREAIRGDHPNAREDAAGAAELAEALRSFFEGERVRFETIYDWGDASAFDVAVWKACARLGYGRTVSYGDLAERVGRPRAARAVGAAMGRNPRPIVVPCHRVTRSDGSLGGYSGPGGTEFKQRLLAMEQAVVGREAAPV